MQISQIPRKFNLPFANTAGSSFINYPVPDVPSGTPGQAALSTGFPPINFSPVSAGGIPPKGSDFNALLYQITAWNQWQAVGGAVSYDPAFQTAIGGYPIGATVRSGIVFSNYWQSIVEDNLTNPDAGGAGWQTPPTIMGTGFWQWRPDSTPIASWLTSNGTTIGNAGSAATQIAAANAYFAFKYLWSTFSNTQCPVSGGRGASADADWTALKTIGTLNMQGISIMGVDGMGGTPTGLLNGVPVVSGSATIAGSVVGENLHTLITAELAAHTHPNVLVDPGHDHFMQNNNGGQSNAPGNPGGDASNTRTGFSTTGMSITNASQGGGGAHNNVPRSMLGYWFMKL